jgi:hypothetical protein
MHSHHSPLEKYSARTVYKLLEYSGHGLIWIAVAVLLLYGFPEHAHLAVNLLTALMVDLLFVGLLKMAFRRSRPNYNKGIFACAHCPCS